MRLHKGVFAASGLVLLRVSSIALENRRGREKLLLLVPGPMCGRSLYVVFDNTTMFCEKHRWWRVKVIHVER